MISRRFALAASLWLAACEPPPEPEPEPIRPVRTEIVQVVSGLRTRMLSGSAQAGAETQLSFKVSGTLESLLVKVGDTVKKGQKLATLDEDDYRLQLSEAQASVGAARAQSRTAQTDYDRVRKLYANGNAAKAELDRARGQFDAARAQLASANQRIKLLKKQVRYTTLYAPADGTVARTTAEVDENLSTGQPVIVLSTGARTEVIVPMPESLIGEVEPQMPVDVRFPAAGGQTIKGTVTEISPVAQGMSTYPVTVVLDEESAAVRPGMAAEISFTFGEANAAPVVRVPLVAVGEDREGRHVLLVTDIKESQGVVKRQPVTVGDIAEGGFNVESGLKGGEVLITAGLRHVQPGMQVKLMASTLTQLAPLDGAGEGASEPAPAPAPEQAGEGAPQ